MKVKLKKHKNSPAPRSTEQVKIESPIEILRKNSRTYVSPVRLFHDRGYQQFIDLNEKTSAPIMTEQAKIAYRSNVGENCIAEKTKRDHIVENTVELVLKSILLNPCSEISLKQRITVVKDVILDRQKAMTLPFVQQGFFDATLKIWELLSNIESNL